VLEDGIAILGEARHKLELSVVLAFRQNGPINAAADDAWLAVLLERE
jgi:hypothetical protein